MVMLVSVLGLVLGMLTIGAFLLLDRPTWLYYYRVVDDHTLVVGVVAQEGAWTRVTGIQETVDAVGITVSSFGLRLGTGPDAAVPIEVPVTLPNPIGTRAVIDGSSGLPVQRTRCLPPAYLAPGCT